MGSKRINSYLYLSRYTNSFPRPYNLSSVMTSPLNRVRQLLEAFTAYYDKEFKWEWISTLHVADTEPHPEALSVFEVATKEYNAFLDFNKKHSTSTSTTSSCQCTLIERGNQHIVSKNIPHNSYTFNCDCGKSITPLVPTETRATDMTYDVHQDLIDGHFDHLFTSVHSIPSGDQPGHGGCVYTAIAKWTLNEEIRNIINRSYSVLGFPPLISLSDTHVRIIVSLFSHCFISSEISCETFQTVLDTINEDTAETSFDSSGLTEDNFEPFMEWLFVGTAKYIAGDEEPLLAKLRRDVQSLTPKGAGGVGCVKVETLAAAGFFEIMFPIKYALYSEYEGLYTLMSSDQLLFNEFWEEPGSKAMTPVILVVLVFSIGHLDKTVVSPGVGAYVKGKHTLPAWVIESAKRIETDPGSVTEMIANWDDGNNDIFPAGPISPDAESFKKSKRGRWISKLPRFINLSISDADENLAETHLKFSPLGTLFGVLILGTFLGDLDPRLVEWIYKYRQNTHLFGCDIGDERWSRIVAFELKFIYTHRNNFFNQTADPMTIHDLPATMSNWCYSSLINFSAPTPRGPTITPKMNRMLAELRDHNQAPSSAALQPRAVGTKRHRARPGAYTFGANHLVPDTPISCAVAAIVALVKWIAGVDVLELVNERFPPLNNIGVSFAMISSIEIVHELIDWRHLPVESTIRGSILWKSKLFRELDVGFYWVQVDLRDSVQFTVEHVIAVHIIKDWKLCHDPGENVVGTSSLIG